MRNPVRPLPPFAHNTRTLPAIRCVYLSTSAPFADIPAPSLRILLTPAWQKQLRHLLTLVRAHQVLALEIPEDDALYLDNRVEQGQILDEGEGVMERPYQPLLQDRRLRITDRSCVFLATLINADPVTGEPVVFTSETLPLAALPVRATRLSSLTARS